MAQIPVNLSYEMAKQEIAGCLDYCIRNLGTPACMLSVILRDNLRDISNLEQQELQHARQTYATARAAEEAAQDQQIEEEVIDETIENIESEN